MNLDSKHLATLEVIRREGSLTKAAAVLTTSQPALSRLVAELELRLDAPLFDRSAQPWRLTKLGDALAQQGAAILRAQRRAVDELVHFRSGRLGTLRIAGPPFFTDGVISRLLPRFRADNPGMSFELSYGYAAELREAVATGRCDLALYPLPPGDPVRGLEFLKLFEARNVIACRADHPILRLSYPRPLALLDYGWIVPPEGSPLAQDMRTVLSKLEMQEAEIVFAGSSLAGVLSFLMGSDCLAVLPETTVNAVGQLFGIRAVPIETDTPSRTIGVLTRPHAELDAMTRTFVAYLDGLPDWDRTGGGEARPGA